jgi:large subunit ribosomal protein L21
MLFAVIATGGKQYRVSPGSFVTVEKVAGEKGDQVVFSDVLLVDGEKEQHVGVPTISGATVTATVVEQVKSAKVRVSTYKAKKRQRRTLGHRQLLTQVKVMAINLP